MCHIETELCDETVPATTYIAELVNLGDLNTTEQIGQINEMCWKSRSAGQKSFREFSVAANMLRRKPDCSVCAHSGE